MERAIKEVIKNYEPRADVFEVLVEDRSELNALTVSVAFMILNDPDPVILDVILERVR
jgi:predicted component of type VI protein secretion system